MHLGYFGRQLKFPTRIVIQLQLFNCCRIFLFSKIKDGEPVYYVHGLQHGLSAKVHGNNIYYYQFDAQG